ncbi:MAG TPA: carboxypeptidase-like regulatory domain-containing protein [Bryobacteraceae bacterium]|nr:carboxypeptidase-like regulatory domain-containing protein [Bryobacteraceae bacterium]
MNNIRKFWGVVTLALCAMTHLFAQDSRGRIVGQVTDSSTAAVPEATVIATNKATGVAVRSVTNVAGAYSLPYLLPGVYTVSAEKDGFKKFQRDNIQVRVNDSVELVIEMQIGNVTESISVTADTPLLQTAEATLGQVVDERRITELPLFAGNAMDLVHLAPGTVNGTDMRLRKAPFNNAPSQFSTTGGGNYNNDFTIDGVSNTYSDGTSPRVAYSPPAASITEFKVQTASYDATIGNTFGATVNVSTKGGTNQLHGEFHEWLRNSAFDTKNIFQNRSGATLPVYQDNRFGNSLGGPVYIPKVYNGKNKTFWFYSWEANLFGNPQSYTTTVPTDKMRNGDLSEYLGLGANYQVYDPFSTVTAPNGRFSRTPVPGNIIPASRLDKVAQNMMKLYPAANAATTTALQYRNNFFNTNKALETYWSTIFRFDHAFSDTHRLFVRFHKDYWEEDKNRTFNNDVNGIILNRNNKGIALDDVYVFSPSFLMNLRYGITYQDFPERRVSQGTDLVALGFSSQLAGLIPKELATIPRTAVTPFQEFSAWESGDGVTASLIHNPVATFTWLKGSHNVRFGTDSRIYRENRNRFNTAVSPQFTFNSTYTRGPLDSAAAPQLGGEVASFLMGVPAGSMSIVDSTAEQSSVFGFYIQDDYKMTRKLTVNIGLRYEYDTPITERFDRAVTGFAADQTNPISEVATANYARSPIPELPVSAFKVNGGLLFAGANGARDYWKGEKNNFMPRIGLAYQWDSKTVVRAGYGLFFNSIGILATNTIVTGFSQSTPIQATLDNGLTFIASTANPFPTGLQQPLRAAGGLSTNLGQGISFFPDRRLNPYAQRWSAGFQRELPMLFLLEATYVGNRGTRLNVNRNINALPNQYLSTTGVRDQERINFLDQQFSNPFRGTNPIYGANISRAQLLRPYPHFNGVSNTNGVVTNEPVGYAWYHSLQMRIERRFNKGFTYQLSYTWSKSMEAMEFLNDGDPVPSEVVSGGDRTHRITSSGIWEIPFGKGRAFGNTWHPVAEFTLGGWQLGGVWQHQSGAPLGFGNRIFNGDLNNIVLPKDQRSVDQWFNLNAGFNRVAAQQLASNLRTFPIRFNGVRGPNQDRWDFSLIKNFKIKERFNTQFRAETFNAWNHPTLTNPNTDPTSGSFGVITGQDATRSWQFALVVKF